jgi:C-terminal processing protease CtpA/Prc
VAGRFVGHYAARLRRVLPSTEQSDGTVVVSEQEYEMNRALPLLDEVRGIRRRLLQGLDDDALVLGAVRGMLESVDDPYTFYYTPGGNAPAGRAQSGRLRGLGLLLPRTRTVMLVCCAS